MTSESLFTAQLGDIVSLPDGRRSTVRAVHRKLGMTVGSMAGFVLAGEIGPFCALLSLPPAPSMPIGVYVPVPRVPPYAKDATEVLSGVISYWAPHVPGFSGAMGELGFKVASVRGQVEPMVLLWRGEELVVFVYSMGVDAALLRMEAMRRDPNFTERDVPLHAAIVTTPDRVIPELVPEPVHETARPR